MPKLPFIETGFAKDLLLFATYPESESVEPADSADLALILTCLVSSLLFFKSRATVR